MINTYNKLPDLAEGVELEEPKEKYEELIEEGYYPAIVESFTVKNSSKTGVPYLEFKIRVMNKSQGRIVYKSYFPYHNDTGLNIFHSFLQALGFSKELRHKFKPSVHMPILCGLKTKTLVGTEEFETSSGEMRKKNIIKKVFPGSSDKKEEEIKALMLKVETKQEVKNTDPFGR
jgi:hypothetical protein